MSATSGVIATAHQDKLQTSDSFADGSHITPPERNSNMAIPSPRKPLGNSLKDMISSSYFQGLVALASLITAIASDNLWIRIPALLILFWFLLALRSVVWPWIRNTVIWLTWKFALGVAVGIIAGALLVPLLEPVYTFGVSLVIPQVEVLGSEPQSGGTLQRLDSFVKVSFSERIRPQYHSPIFINAKITPYIPIRMNWLYDYDLSDCCQTLWIESAKYFPNTNGPTFEPNKTYHLRISGLLLKNPVDIEFHTLPQ